MNLTKCRVSDLKINNTVAQNTQKRVTDDSGRYRHLWWKDFVQQVSVEWGVMRVMLMTMIKAVAGEV